MADTALRQDVHPNLSKLPPAMASRFYGLISASNLRVSAVANKNRRQVVAAMREASDDLVHLSAKAFDWLRADKWNLQDARRYGHDRLLIEATTRRIHQLGHQIDRIVHEGMRELFVKGYMESAYRLDQLTPAAVRISRESLREQDPEVTAGINFDIPDQNAIDALILEPFKGATFSDRLGLITDEMAQDIKGELLRSMMEQESWQQVAQRIRSEMGAGTVRAATWRANMIARTELRRASSLGAITFADQNSDIIEKTIWLAHPGACPICLDLNGSELESEDDYPPEQSHPNCTCTHADIPKKWDKILDEATPDLAAPRQSFEDWSAENGFTA